MENYTSLDQIKKDFNIDDADIETVRDRIKAVMAKNHPDRTAGKFPNDAVKDNYHKANKAMIYLDSLNDKQVDTTDIQSLLVIEKMTDLIRVVTELVPGSKQSSLEQSLDSKISFAITNIKSKLFVPKISLTAITAVVTFIFLFPGQIKENPLFSAYLNPGSETFAIVWLSLLMYSG